MGRLTVVSSWGNVVHGTHTVLTVGNRAEAFPEVPGATKALPFGNGRSYGDSCLNSGGALLQTRSMDRFIHFERESGVLTCEAGMLLGDILRLAVPAGWFLPVVPGTQYVTLGGAIANDVHGKNHHRAGTLGAHIRWLELLRSDGSRLRCSPMENPEWFAATVGGLGLTGLIVAAEIQMRPVAGPWMNVETIRYPNCEAFFRLSAESDESHEYTVAWVDCLAGGKNAGRGLLQRANHSPRSDRTPETQAQRVSIPFAPPVSLINPLSLRVFNTLHYHRQRHTRVRSTSHYQSFFFPLDGIHNWNRLYGPRGFYQYQCVIPVAAAHWATAELLGQIRASGQGSFLAVLKRCGAALSPGLLSFPREGVTLALDFPNRGALLGRLFDRLDRIVANAGGRLYPAKDARMPAELFQRGYPQWKKFSDFVDPRCSSDFWRRVAAST